MIYEELITYAIEQHGRGKINHIQSNIIKNRGDKDDRVTARSSLSPLFFIILD
jgi:hypothetical protein